MNISGFAHALGGSVIGRNRVSCPGPGHSSQDRSLSVLFDPGVPGGFVVHSHAGDDALRCRDFVKARLGLGELQRSDAPPSVEAESDRERTARALALWHAAASPAGTPIESYLHRRGVEFAPPRASDVIRWHRDCPFGGKRVGCMIALVRDIVTDEPRAIHRTALDDSGRKLSELGSNGRLTLGPVGNGAVKFTAHEDVTSAVAIGEGLESCLSARRLPDLSGLPVWSLLSAGQVARFPVLGGIETLWLVVDRDRAGVEAARTAYRRWHNARREVVAITPTIEGTDLNDVAGGSTHA